MGVDFLLRNAKKIIIFTLIMTSIGVTISLFLSAITRYSQDVLPFLDDSFVPYFMPPNLITCTSIVISVKTVGTVYEMAMQLIQWKVDILA
jgi:hypothetical protein